MQAKSGIDAFDRALAALHEIVARPVADPVELTANLHAIYRTLFAIDLARFDRQMVRGASGATLGEIFRLRTRLRDRIAAWQSQGLMTREVQQALRDVFRISRYAADMLGEIAIGHDRLAEGETSMPAFSGSYLHTQFHPDLEGSIELVFQPGDVMLVRGCAHNSAAIARIGDADSQFSHIALIDVDETGKTWVVESLIEEGAIVRPLEEALDHDLARAVLFRHRDRALAARAAAMMREHVLKTLDGTLPHIPYDFTMRMTGRDTLFCSKLVRLAYEMASDGEYMLPAFQTRLDMRNRDFIDRIGVLVDQTFAPGDIELQHEFDLVAEWRDYRVTSDVRIQDLVMTKLFEWMEVYDYRFRETAVSRLITLFGSLSRHISGSARKLLADVLPKVPANMSRRCIAAIVMLHGTAEPLAERLRCRELAHIRRTGHQMHPRSVLDHLEAIRRATPGRIGYLRGRRAPLKGVVTEMARLGYTSHTPRRTGRAGA